MGVSVFEKRWKSIDEVIHKAVGLVEEYDKASKILLNPSFSAGLNYVLRPPGAGCYKVNSDAASFANGVGLAGVTRDCECDVVVTTCVMMKGVFSVECAEAMTLRFSLKISIEAGFNNLILEVDNLKLFTHLSKGTIEPTPFGSTVNDIRFLYNQCFHVSFSFVRREGNQVAHNLARISCKFAEFRVWLESVPSELDVFVAADSAAN